jgi:hypothetical protein
MFQLTIGITQECRRKKPICAAKNDSAQGNATREITLYQMVHEWAPQHLRQFLRGGAGSGAETPGLGGPLGADYQLKP